MTGASPVRYFRRQVVQVQLVEAGAATVIKSPRHCETIFLKEFPFVHTWSVLYALFSTSKLQKLFLGFNFRNETILRGEFYGEKSAKPDVF